jgi:hypothetical protein
MTSPFSESKRFNTDESRFHQELVSTFTEGLNLPSSITSNVEGVLTEIKQAITAAHQSGNGANKLKFVIVLNVFRIEEMIGSWQLGMQCTLLNPAEDRKLMFSTDTRAIGFRPDDSLITHIRNKNETTKVNLSVQYNHCNTRFDN